MAETVKKPRAAKPKTDASTNGTAEAKSRKAPAKKTAVSTQPTPINGSGLNGSGPTHEQIAELARKYWAQRGYTDGHQEEDWLRAERELGAKAS